MATTKADGLPFLPGNNFVDPTVSIVSLILFVLIVVCCIGLNSESRSGFNLLSDNMIMILLVVNVAM